MEPTASEEAPSEAYFWRMASIFSLRALSFSVRGLEDDDVVVDSSFNNPVSFLVDSSVTGTSSVFLLKFCSEFGVVWKRFAVNTNDEVVVLFVIFVTATFDLMKRDVTGVDTGQNLLSIF